MRPIAHRRERFTRGSRPSRCRRAPAHIDRLERGRRHGLELIEQVVAPVGVARALEVPVRAVVGEHQPVQLHRAQDRPRPRAEPAEVEVRPEPEARAHRRTLGVVDTGLVACRPDGRVSRARDREPDRVGDAARLDLVPAHEPRRDREPGGVGGRSGLGAEPVRVQVEDGTAPRARVAMVPRRGEQLVEPAHAALDD
jgi:hypothetical protein